MKTTPFTPSTATMPRQISKKFRSYIIARLAETCGLLTNGDAIKSATLSAIEKYISENIIPAKSLPREILLIFTILRPEIDRAIERSAQARCRVRKHPSAPEQSVPTPVPSNTDSTNGPRRFNPNGPLMHNDNLTSISSLYPQRSGQTKLMKNIFGIYRFSIVANAGSYSRNVSGDKMLSCNRTYTHDGAFKVIIIVPSI